MIINPIIPIRREDLEKLLAGEFIEQDEQCPGWLEAVRLMPCMRIGCNDVQAGTAHHVLEGGMARKCSDYLAIPLCIDDHVTGPDPVQQMNEEKFEEAIGMSMKDAVRRVHAVLMDKINQGEFV